MSAWIISETLVKFKKARVKMTKNSNKNLINKCWLGSTQNYYEL